MKALLIALVVLSMTPDVLADGSVWERKRVVVRDHTSEPWRPLVADAVAEFNRVRSRHVPRLRYRDAVASCRSPRRGIAVCSVASTAFAAGFASYRPRRGVVASAKVVLSDAYRWDDPLNTVCHELFHALTDASEHKIPAAEPCPYNERFARRVYRQHRKH